MSMKSITDIELLVSQGQIKIKKYVTLIVSRQMSLESVELELQEEVQRRVEHYFD